jgi:Bacterial Ig-like domain (group 2)
MVMLVAASACGHSSPTSPPTSPTEPTVSQLRISGLPASLGPGATAQMTAQEVLTNATVKDCAATWSVDDAQVAGVSPTGLLTARSMGYATVVASCEGLTARGETKVEATVAYTLNVVPFDSALTKYGCVAATMEFLDGPLAGRRTPICTGPNDTWLQPSQYGATMPVRVRFTAESYDPKEAVLAESTGSPRATRVVWDFPVPMTFVPDPLTDTFVGTVSFKKEISYPFTVGAPGKVRVRSWWSLDYNDRVSLELWCGGQRLQRTWSLSGATGGGFSQDVQSPGQCEVKVQPDINGTTLHRLAITYPR